MRTRKIITIPSMALVTDDLGYFDIEELSTYDVEKLRHLPGVEVTEIPDLDHGMLLKDPEGRTAKYIGMSADRTQAVVEFDLGGAEQLRYVTWPILLTMLEAAKASEES